MPVWVEFCWWRRRGFVHWFKFQCHNESDSLRQQHSNSRWCHLFQREFQFVLQLQHFSQQQCKIQVSFFRMFFVLDFHCGKAQKGTSTWCLTKIFLAFLRHLGKTSCPILSQPVPSPLPHIGKNWDLVQGNWHLGPGNSRGSKYSISGPMSLTSTWHLRHNILSHPMAPYLTQLHGQDWNGHISASDQDRALKFGSYEISLQALSWFYNLVAVVTFAQ